MTESDLDNALDAYENAKAAYSNKYNSLAYEKMGLEKLKEIRADMISDTKSIGRSLYNARESLNNLKWYQTSKKKSLKNTIGALENKLDYNSLMIERYNAQVYNAEQKIAGAEREIDLLRNVIDEAYNKFMKIKDEWAVQFQINQAIDNAMDNYLEYGLPVVKGPTWSEEEIWNFLCGIADDESIKTLAFEDGFPVLFQNHGQPWSGIDFQNSSTPGTTISSSACSIISMAMAMYAFGGDAAPYEAIAYALGKYIGNTENYRDKTSSGIDTDFFTDYALVYGIETQEFDAGYINSSDENKNETEVALLEALDNGGTAVVRAAKNK